VVHTSLARTRRPLRCVVGLAMASASTLVSAEAPQDLTTLTLEQLLQVSIVGASKYEQPQAAVAAAVSVITRQEIKAHGWRTIDEALGTLPGIHTTYDRLGTQLGARGFGLPGDFNTRVLVLLNGNRVNDPTYDSGFVGRNFPVDIDLVERIEFIPGPGGAVYGQNAMFGVVNVITRSGADLAGAELAFRYEQRQSRREGRASWGALFDNGVDLMVSASGFHARGEDHRYEFGAAGVSGVAHDLDGERAPQFYARIGRGGWSLEQAYGRRRKEDPTAAYFSDPLTPGQFQDATLAVTQLQYQGRLMVDSLQVSARLFRGDMNFRSQLYYSGESSASRTRSAWHGAELRFLSTAVSGHTLLLGVEAQDNTHADLHIPIPLDPSHDILVTNPGHRIGLFAQDEWHITTTLAGTLGVRVDRGHRTEVRTSPRAALIWQATPATVLKALYGRAYREPNLFERSYDDGATLIANPELQGERIDTAELVADRRLGRDLTLRGSLYQWSMYDLVALGIEAGSGIPQYQSGGRINARGLELSADRTWDGGYRMRGSVSLQDVEHANSGTALLNSPRLLGSLNASAPLPVGWAWLGAGVRGSYELHYGSQRLSVAGSSVGGYTQSNLVLSKEHALIGLDVSLAVFNLFDKRYAQPGATTNWQNEFEQDGRSVRIQLVYGFGR
jgi:outer membrane receptor protein involved in Fe transport